MTDRHKYKPITWRGSADEREWLEDYSRQSGQPVRQLLSRGIALLRAQAGAQENKTTTEGNG
jgi:hypothetical protein